MLLKRLLTRSKKSPGKLTWLALGALVIVLLLSPILIQQLLSPDRTEAGWYNSNWKYRKPITIDNTQISGNEALANFPVLVSITDTQLSSSAQADGDDILFTDLAGNKLAHEIESYNSGTGELIAWVNVPAVATDTDTVFLMYFGNSYVESQEQPAQVWSGDYAMVHHFEETTTGNADIRDSTSNNNHSDTVVIDGAGSNPDATGQIGSAVEFDGSNDYIRLPSSGSLDLSGNATFEAWINFDTFGGSSYGTIVKREPSGSGGFEFLLDNNGATEALGFYGNGYSNSNNSVVSTNTWYHVAAVLDSGTVTFYVNGDAAGSASHTLASAGSYQTFIGTYTPGNEQFDGIIDELRLSSTARTADWLKTSYTNQNNPGSFLSVGVMETEPNPGPIAYWRFDEGVDDSCPDGADACDSLGTVNGTKTGASWQGQGDCVLGQCLYFDGSDDVVEMSEQLPGTITHEETITASTTSSSSTTTGTIGGGSDMFYVVSVNNRSHAVSSVSGLGLTWTERITQCSGRWQIEGSIYTAYGSPSSGTITVNHTGTENSATVIVSRYSGVDSTTPYEDVTGENTNGEGGGCSGGTDGEFASLELTSTNDDSVHYYVTAERDGGIEVPDSGLTLLDTTSANTGGEAISIFAHYRDMPTAGTYDMQHELFLITDWATMGLVINPGPGTNEPPAPVNFGQGLSDEFTISTWVKPSSDGESNAGEIYSKGSNNYLRVTNQGSDGLADLEASLALSGTNATLSLTDGLKLDQWQQVSLTYADDGDDEIQIYIDGQLIGTSTNGSGSPVSETNPLLVGGSTGNNYHGYIDEFKIYDYVRTSSEIKSEAVTQSDLAGASAVLGSGHQGVISQGLIGYWPLNEASGNASDFSGNDLTLTNNNTTAFDSGYFSRASSHTPGSSHYFSTATTINGVQSVAFWVYPDSNTNYYLSLTTGAYITSSSGTLSATGFTNPQIFVNGQQTTTIEASKWQHVVVVSQTAINADQFYLGRQGANYFDGQLDEVRLYERELSPDEAKQIYRWAPGPVLHLKFDEAPSASTALDTSGLGHNGSLFGSMATTNWIPGVYGRALDLDGTDDYVEADESIITGYPFSISHWVKTEDCTDYHTTFQLSDASASNVYWRTYILSAGGGGCKMAVGLSNTTFTWNQGFTTFGDSKWHHVVAVFKSPTERELWIDGVLEEVGSFQVDWNSNVDRWSVGYSGDSTPSNYTDGQIDDVRIYNYALTPYQIAANMYGSDPSRSGDLPLPVLDYKFDQTTGTTLENSNPQFVTLTGTMDASMAWAGTDACRFGSCLEFTSIGATVTNDEIISFHNGLNKGGSVAVWFNPDSDGGSNQGQLFVKNASGFYCRTQNESGSTVDVACYLNMTTTDLNLSASGVDLNQWHHLAVVYDQFQNRGWLYLNGELVDTATTAGDIDTGVTDSDWTIGGLTSFGFDGHLDEFKLYSFPLTDDQVDQVMNQSSLISASPAEDQFGGSQTSTGSQPLVYLPFSENAGTTTADLGSENLSFTGTSITESDWYSCVVSSCVKYDGSSDFSSGTSFNPPGTGSVNFWFKYDSTPTTIYEIFGASSDFQARINSSGIVYFDLGIASGSNTTFATSTALSTDTWYHLAANFNASSNTFEVYIDGVLDNSGSLTLADSSGGTLKTGLGTGGGGVRLQGSIDEFRIYDYELSPDQIAYDFNQGKPIGHWKLDECQGSTTYDASGRGNNGTLSIGGSGSQTSAGDCDTNATTAWYQGRAGKFDSGLNFDGTDDSLDMGDVDLLSFERDQSFSISTWIKTSVDGGMSVVAKQQDTGDERGWNLQTGGSGYIFLQLVNSYSSNAIEVRTTNDQNYSDSNWHHLVATYDGSSNASGVRLYVDGIEQAVTTNLDSLSATIDNAASVEIGSRNGAEQFFNGQIDDVRIYSYELSPDQVKSVYNGGALRF